jgi:hypothetical protein
MSIVNIEESQVKNKQQKVKYPEGGNQLCGKGTRKEG